MYPMQRVSIGVPIVPNSKHASLSHHIAQISPVERVRKLGDCSAPTKRIQATDAP